MKYLQIIEYRTRHADQLSAIMDQWMEETEGRRTALRSVMLTDRDQADTFVMVVEFSSYDDAMRNSALPETGKYAEQISALCESPPVFHNLDVLRDEQL